MVRSRLTPKPVTTVLIQTPAPSALPQPEGNVRRPWPWQTAAIKKLKGCGRRLLTAPTGSGKSTVVEALGLNDLAQGKKVIVAVPQLSIGRGYEREVIEVDGKHREWYPVHVLTADVRSIVRFLVEPAAESESGRTLVCTHVALALAAQHPDIAVVHDPWNDVSLFLDEAHHVLTFDGGAAERKEACALENALGAIVRHYLRERSGPLTLITATWMRTDDGAIVPRSELDTFARYHRTFDQHMKDMQHVRTLEIRFIVGRAPECLAALFEERHPSELKTVVWHPAPGSELLNQQGGKHEALAAFRAATGWRRRRVGAWDLHTFDSKRFTALELIDDSSHRDVSMKELLDGIREQKRAAAERRDVDPEMRRTPDVVWALNMLREGSDYPALARGILTAPRGSMLDTLQMLGRLLRDFPGKDRVEFDIILPTGGPSATPSAAQVSRYLKSMVASLLVEWQFRGLGFEAKSLPEEEQRELSSLEQADVQEQLTSDLVDAAIRLADIGLDAEDEAERIAAHVFERGKSASGLTPAAKKIVKHRLRQMLVGRRVGAAAGEGAFDVEETLVGRLRSFVGRFGYEDFEKLWEALGRPSHVTVEQVRDAMRLFRRRHGRWPRHTDSGEVPGIGGSWASAEHALRRGFRGLPGGSSLAMERDGAIQRKPLTLRTIKDAVLEFHQVQGSWPGPSTRKRSPTLGYCWAIVDRALKRGDVDPLPKGSSLAAIVRECHGRPASVRLTLALVHDALRAYHAAHAKWPCTTTSGLIPILGEPWKRLDVALRLGLRGLPKRGSDGQALSLARVVAQLRGVPPSSTPLTVEMVKASVLAWRGQTGEWPSRKSDGIAPMIGVRWCSLDGFLRMARRGLPGGLNLTKVAKLIEAEKYRARTAEATSNSPSRSRPATRRG